MTRYVIIRIMQGVIALIVATMLVFILSRLSGDPLNIMLPETAPEEQRQQMAEYLGLDKPIYLQYFIFIGNAIRGDLGRSIFFYRPVADLIIERLPATMMLGLTAMAISMLVAVPIGVYAAVKREKWQDGITKVLAIVGQSAPAFWLGIMLILVFAVRLRLLPAGGYGHFSNLILPALTVATFPIAGFMRLTRSAMLDTLGTDYVRLARIKGLSERQVIWKHGLRNALIPVVTYTGVVFVNALTGSVIVETVFAWPGIGQMAYQALNWRDFPLIQGILVFCVGLFVLVNLIIDIIYIYLDPRVRLVRG
jgi:ABC-type dipeptide/oligopeptide/nickel transport system permease component